MRTLVVSAVAVGCWLAVAVGGASAAAPQCMGQKATIVGTSGADVLRGTSKRDVIVGRAGNDRIYGLGGKDLICGGRGDDVIDGGAGNDSFDPSTGLPGGLDGGPGNDRILGGEGDDEAFGGRGADVIMGGPGDDACLNGMLGSNRIYGGPGDDCLVGGHLADELDGGEGNDWLVGFEGDDTIRGGQGDDQLLGEEGDDSADGGAGADHCRAEEQSLCEPFEVGGDFEAGTYVFDGLEPDVTLTIGEGWASTSGLSDPYFAGMQQGSAVWPNEVGIAMVPEEVYDRAAGDPVPLEEPLLDWVTAQECIEVTSAPAPGVMAGVSGTLAEFTVSTADECWGRLGWDYTEDQGWIFVPGERYRMLVGEVGGTEVIVNIYTSNPDQWDAFVPLAEAVLATVTFG